MISTSSKNNFFVRVFLLVFVSLPLISTEKSNQSQSFNSFGQVGLIQMPSAEIRGEGSLSLTFTKNDIYKFGALTISPFNWMEASYFYYRPSDIFWTDESSAGKYLDKGFNIKFLLKPYKKTNFAIGLDDFAGWGYFSKEYFMTTTSFESLKVSTGIGWGAYSDLGGYKNPLFYIDDDFINRPVASKRYSKGGTLSYDRWFKGNSSIIGGFEYIMPNRNFSIKVEYDPFDYINGLSSKGALGNDPRKRKKDSNVNFGINYQYNRNFQIGLSFIKGNTINFNFTLGEIFTKKNSVKKDKKSFQLNRLDKNKDITFYEDLLINLNRNNVFLQTAAIKNDDLNIAVSSSQFKSPIRLAKYSSEIAHEVSTRHNQNYNRINITSLNAGIELNKIGFLKTQIAPSNNNQIFELIVRNTEIKPGNRKDFLNNEFRPNLLLPAIFSQTKLGLVHHIGDPAKFYFGGLNLNINSEVQFSRSLILTNSLSLVLYDNFDDKRNFPDSLSPMVRTEIVKYLQDSNDFYSSRSQLDYYMSPKKEIYLKLSSGIFEDMYGGLGFESLYKPFDKNFSVGYEFYTVKKRGYKRRLKFLDYKVNTRHVNFNYLHPQTGIIAKLSYGSYLAGDKGYTVDISRRLKSGFRAGFFFTRTDMSALDFGEGSFDKGFYFQIPLDFFSNDYSIDYYNFRISPLTRDGGAKLNQGNRLEDVVHSSSYSEVYRDWIDFLE
jgi:hypothetical protein